jgi:hypothetical protein
MPVGENARTFGNFPRTETSKTVMTRNFTPVLLLLLLPFTGCAVHIPQPSAYTNLQIPAAAPEEALLLDVAIGQFTFEQPLKDGAPDMQVANIRTMEARYMPVMLRHSLAQTGMWAAVHVLPEAGYGHDLRVDGEILESEPHTLRLRISVHDASGTQWFENIYTEHVGAEVHGDNALGVNDPFDSLYNRIANDMLLYVQQNLDAGAIAGIRQLAELQFGNEFAPDVYGGYLTVNRKGIASVSRLPPANDPAVAHLARIRQRNAAFEEVLQQRYMDFARQISDSYFQFRREGFRELQDLQRQQKDARNDIVGGAILLGVAAATSNIDSTLTTIGTAATAVAGAAMVRRGVTNYDSNTPFLDELAESFSGEVATETVTLDEEVITLSGSTESIYSQWKDILRELLVEDRSLAAPAE